MAPNDDAGAQPDRERINELYWNSDHTVAEITEELGVSRNALYTAIHPLAAGVSCAECGERMVYPNRTRRDSSSPVCRACGAESTGDEFPAADAVGEGRDRQGSSGLRGLPIGRMADAETWQRWRGELAAVEPERFALVGGAAALGAMLGAAATLAIRERG